MSVVFRLTQALVLGGYLFLGLALAACGRTSEARDSELIVLLGGDALAGSTRVAERLGELTDFSGTLGPADEFRVVAQAGDGAQELNEAAAQLEGARAVIAFVGDIAELPGVNPDEELRRERRLSVRDWDRDRLATDLVQLEQRCQELGATLILATVPLGRQAHVEVPELLALRAWVVEYAADHGLRLLDTARAFEERGGREFFEDDTTRLDDIGHELLAEVLQLELVSNDALIPARDAAETLARRDLRALESWRRGVDGEITQLAQGISNVDLDLRASTLRTAAALATIGKVQNVRDRLEELAALGTDYPSGLALGRRLASDWDADPTLVDPLEERILELLDELVELEQEDWDVALAITRDYPHRLSAWVTLEFTRQRLRRGIDTARLAREARAIYDSPLSDQRFEAILDSWRFSINFILLLLIAESEQVGAIPRGELIATARRRQHLGMTRHAANYFVNRAERHNYPTAWREEGERLQRLADEATADPTGDQLDDG